MRILTADFVLPISSGPIEKGAVAIDRDKIIGIGKEDLLIETFRDANIEKFGEAVLMPGLVNCHSHLEITALRGFLDEADGDFFSWLLKLTKTRAEKLTTEDLKIAAIFGALEGVRAGVTCFGDIGRTGIAGMEALKISGIRGILFQETMFSPVNESAEEHFDDLIGEFTKIQELESNLVKTGLSPHSPYTVSRRLFEKISEFAISNKVPITIHAAESRAEDAFLKTGTGFFAGIYKKQGVNWQFPGVSAIQYLKEIGVLVAKPLLGHCVAVSDSDISLIKESKARIAHCPKSNAKFGHGIAPLSKFLENNISVGFGTDSMASNNTCDLFEESRFAALLARAQNEDSEFLSAKRVIEIATKGGAEALGLENDIGTLEIGKQADIIAVSLDNAAQMPVHDIYSALLFATSARDVTMTMVAGEVLYGDGVVKSVDESQLKQGMKIIAGKMRS